MLDSDVPFATAHPNFTYWLDEGARLGALALGALWTYWNYRKSRTYAQKLELELTGEVFFKDGVYVNIATSLINRGASIFFSVQQKGTSCTLSAIHKDLSVTPIRIFPIFVQHNQMEPGEQIHDALFWRIDLSPKDLVWIKIDLRIVSDKVEWNSVALIRVGEGNPVQLTNPLGRGDRRCNSESEHLIPCQSA